MASEEETVAFSLPDHQTLDPATAPLALCFALSLYFLLIQNPNTPLALAIKLANGVIQTSTAFKYLKSPWPSPAAFFFASKAVVKGIKFSQRLIPSSAAAGTHPSPISVRKAKACVAAVSLLRYAHRPSHADISMELWFLNCGFKFSKNLLRVMDVFLGLQMDEVIRRSVDALGLLFKAAVIVSVIGGRVRKNGRDWKRNSYGFSRVDDLRCGVCLRYTRSYFDRFYIEKRLPCYKVLDFGDGDVAGKELEVSFSELLSLSIPMELDSSNVLQRL